MRYLHRKTARRDLDLVVDVNPEAETVNGDSTLTPTNIPAGMTASRFHIMARIHLEDRSLFLKQGELAVVPAIRSTNGRRPSYPVGHHRSVSLDARSHNSLLCAFLTFCWGLETDLIE
ncbi:hypothetical protein JVT61DRAFT_10748 [Boletus reticuloceps]|uniref:Uncharacterized protein n=1 Tax=Boletus reticuloceps TaxID=495285 RepID=A0A8I2YFL0_9AGAM|nr:hypothetical protein JVT61DRAFT_10748 [Boletus reticuloceps]